ncbi:hypothetical protein VN97_g7856 [Penicillium thymicola]|uniref:Uncharacterized protein n=1 Tax=Penicillium thymicola TaxID=293382 RepID=A0AAI9TET1_PENTH|nr:hypothetical protein VN97_g7856 [Penicillium thymicola]
MDTFAGLPLRLQLCSPSISKDSYTGDYLGKYATRHSHWFILPVNNLDPLFTKRVVKQEGGNKLGGEIVTNERVMCRVAYLVARNHMSVA